MDLFLQYEETFTVSGCTPDALHDVGEQVMEALLALEGGQDSLTDSTVSVDSSEMSITIEMGMSLPAETPQAQAEIAIRSAARTAIHAVGGATPDWEPTPAGERMELISI